MELEKSPAFNPESNDGYRQWSSMNGKSLLKDYWRTLKSWHDFSSLESFQTGHLVITCLTQKAYTESHVKCSRMKLVVANASGAHIPALCPPLSSAAGLGNGSSSLCASTSFHGNLQPRGKGSQWWAWEVLLNSPEVPAEQSSAVYSCHLGNTTLNGLVLPGPLSLLLCPVFWSHFPNKLLALALRSFFAKGFFLPLFLSFVLPSLPSILYFQAFYLLEIPVIHPGKIGHPLSQRWSCSSVSCISYKQIIRYRFL